MTLEGRLVEKGTYSWHVPVIVKCRPPFPKLPSKDQIVKEITRFINCKGDGVETVKEPEGGEDRAASRTCSLPDQPQGLRQGRTHSLHRSRSR